MKESKLKAWVGQRDKLVVQRNIKRSRVKELNLDLFKMNKKIKDLEDKIEGLTNSELKVSDHFVCRWQERVEFISKEEIIKQVITPKMVEDIKTVGNCTYPLYAFPGVSVVIKDNTLITCYNDLRFEENEQAA